MKINSDKWQVTSGKKTRPACGAHSCHSSLVTRHSERGIALVITLILLAVTLVMALAFLAISRRESAAVVSAAETATARNAADSGIAAAEAQAMAGIFAANNPYNFGLIVSTNRDTGNTLAALASLQYSPRAPVLVSSSEPFGRFYLDLNRNGKFEANGYVVQVDNNNNIIGTNYNAVGDPEWIGILERPDSPFGPNNQFIGRIAFMAVPVGNDLDLNAIHNQTETATVNPAPNTYVSDGYFRNEGVGSWELNLASFLADLNTNQWNSTTAPYIYSEPTFNNSGRAFNDALSLLSYRYNFNYNSLALGYSALYNNSIDGYTIGQLMTNTVLPSVLAPPNLSWAGSDNTNHFFTPSDLFDPTKTSVQFTNDLIGAGVSTSTYDSYTFYRMLSQLGTDTAPETGKMNLNYINVDTNGVIVPGMETNFLSWTNPVVFFTNAANRMLLAYTASWMNQNYQSYTNTYGVTGPFGVASIPVYVNGRFVYTPAVQRVLQLAANIYDSTVNNRVNGSPDYPDVFRPLFSRDFNGTGTNIFISGYASVVPFTDGANDVQLLPPFDIATISGFSGTILNAPDNIYGVPWIIGAKKGFPNFNEFSTENNLAVTRRLQLTRTTNSYTPVITSTNQMYMMNMSSSLGIELWNSYAASYPGTVVIGVNDTASLMVTNDDRNHPNPLFWKSSTTNILLSINSWPGTSPSYAGNPNSLSFLALTFNGPILTNSVYRSSYASGAELGPPGNAITPPGFIPTNYFPIASPPTTSLFESSSQNGFFLPQFGVLLTNRLQVFMLDVTTNNGTLTYHVIDYVHFDGPNSAYNVNGILADKDTVNNYVGVWDTNYPTGSSAPTGPTYGILNQIAISKNGSPPAEDGQWQADPEAATLGTTKAQQQTFFQAFFLPGSHVGITTNTWLTIDTPYAPTRFIVQYATWQANDPLVHYLASDINAPTANNTTTPKQGLNESSVSASTFAPLTSLNLGSLNDRYMPWGGNPKLTSVDLNPYNTALKDPVNGPAGSSDNWDFPSYKLPTIAWLGRVHRGTPWQTVYLKSSDILANNGLATWSTWTGNSNPYDAANAAPVQDRLLFDLFTTAPNDNATRGQLSVNQSGLAAWSALLGGVVALENIPANGTVTNVTIQPAGVYDPANPPPLVKIWNGINGTRAGQRNADGVNGAFEHVGDILRTPQLTDQSPFINTSVLGQDSNGNAYPIYPSDEVMEWVPQQVMSLLRVGTPRYVIYSYGQALKPAPNSIVTTAGNNFGMVTNYQVVSEVAERAVVRFDTTVTNINNITVTNNRAVIENFNILPPD